MNPLYNVLGGQPQLPFNNGMIQAFNQFKKNFSGDPKQTVQNLLNSGQMTQAQYNQLSSMASQMMNVINLTR